MAEFDKRYWEDHWDPESASPQDLPANPYLAAETVRLPVGTALDAGCGVGTEALWLAAHGWQVTGADIPQERWRRHRPAPPMPGSTLPSSGWRPIWPAGNPEGPGIW